jgi:hypothetical protein
MNKPLDQVLLDGMNQLINLLPLDNYSNCAKYYWYANRTALFVLYWEDIFYKVVDKTGFALEWDFPLGPTSEQVYLLPEGQN